MGTTASFEFWNNPDPVRGDRESVLWLDDPRCQEANLAGNKAASLAWLAARHKIPYGFAIPNVSVGRSETLSALQQTAIESAYRILGEKVGVQSPTVAVRSSALDEDGTRTSFAGMHDTIRTFEFILEDATRLFTNRWPFISEIIFERR
jgi:phosphoenolpyruvate synthase/pyruvate phosphate dikinase